MPESEKVFVPPSAGGRSENPHVAKEGSVLNPGVKTVPVGSGPTCPSCKQSTLKVRHNRAQGQGRIFCSNCGYDDGPESSPGRLENQGATGVQIKSRHGSGAIQEGGVGVRIRSSRQSF